LWTYQAKFSNRIRHRPACDAAYDHRYAFNLQPGIFGQGVLPSDLERELKRFPDDRCELPQPYLDYLNAPRVLLASFRLGDFDDALRD